MLFFIPLTHTASEAEGLLASLARDAAVILTIRFHPREAGFDAAGVAVGTVLALRDAAVAPRGNKASGRARNGRTYTTWRMGYLCH